MIKPRFMEFTWKGARAVPITVDLLSIEHFNIPSDGSGCSIVLRSGKTMTVTTSYADVKAMIRKVAVLRHADEADTAPDADIPF